MATTHTHRPKWQKQDLEDSMSLLLALGMFIMVLTVMAVYAAS